MKIALCTYKTCIHGMGLTEEDAINDAWENGIDKVQYDFDISKFKQEIEEQLAKTNEIGTWKFLILSESKSRDVENGNCLLM